ncbi:MAG: putative ABC transporter permease [Clostridium sp.]|nr:putative ABC transporter permease [Clostridium sp.]
MIKNDDVVSEILVKFQQYFLLWLTGGIAYFYMEIMFRGYSHYSMIICGGFCFLFVGQIGLRFLYGKSRFFIVKIMAASALIITTLEFVTGLIVNVVFHLEVWDYSRVAGNIMGQVCLPYTFVWGVMGLLCVYMTYMIQRFILE